MPQMPARGGGGRAIIGVNNRNLRTLQWTSTPRESCRGIAGECDCRQRERQKTSADLPR